jgi:hypothetical protein
VVLGEVTDLGVLGPLHRAGWGAPAHRPEAAQQGGLADAVGADDGDALATSMVRSSPAEQRLPRNLALAFHLQGQAVQLLCLLEADEGADPAGGLDLVELDLLDLAAREVACLALEALAEKRLTKVCSSAICAFFLALSACWRSRPGSRRSCTRRSCPG